MSRSKKWYKQLWCMWIIICIFELFLILYFNFDRVRNIVLKMMLDSNGNFNWTVVTALAAVITIIFTWINNNKNIKANLVSKSRIEWIQEVRRVSVEFLDACHNVISLISVIKSSKSESVEPQNGAKAAAKIDLCEEKGRYAEIYNEDKKYLIEEQSRVKKLGSLLTLYLGPDSSNNNEFIVYLIENIVLRISNNDNIFEQGKVLVEDMIKDLKNILRVYFKVEWKRSIGKIDDDGVDDELNKDKIYTSIKNKYKEQYENRNK
ncbi:hypothetical protein [Clostridium sp.]|uniref:hypothetical protein n=1 Tax=Clostridium sp. TaxID=1506 RepID=UPI003217801B